MELVFRIIGYHQPPPGVRDAVRTTTRVEAVLAAHRRALTVLEKELNLYRRDPDRRPESDQ